MAHRTQITLPSEQHRQARARAAELAISLAEYVRRLVARDLGGDVRRASADVLFDLGSSAGADVAAHKDDYVGEALKADRSVAGG